jgi:hypothetical protein
VRGKLTCHGRVEDDTLFIEYAPVTNVDSIRILSLILGVLGSLGALATLGVYYIYFLLANALGPPQDQMLRTLWTLMLVFYLVISILAFSGTIVSILAPKAGGAILLGAGIAALGDVILFWLQHGLEAFGGFYGFYGIAHVGWIAVLLLAGLLAVFSQHSKSPNSSRTATTVEINRFWGHLRAVDPNP